MTHDPEPYFREFLAAAEASARGDHSLARDLVERHPIVRTELWAFSEAIREGRLVRKGTGYRMAKGARE